MLSLYLEIYMPDMAGNQTVEMESGDLKLDLDKAEDEEVSPYYKYTAQLQLNRDYAKSLRDDIVSAKTYLGKTLLLYVLLNHQGKYHWILYDPQSQQLRSPTVVKLLELIACTEDTQVATVNYDTVEEFSNRCMEKWCDENAVSPDEVERICALYLKPEHEGDDVREWLNLPGNSV